MTATVDGVLGDLVGRSKTPGIQFACVDSGGTIRSFAAGWADLRQRRQMTAATPLMVYSVSKVVTAYAVSTLARGGDLGLDDPVERYLPKLPYGPQVTIRHLLEHRSGIPNPVPLRWVHAVASSVEHAQNGVGVQYSVVGGGSPSRSLCASEKHAQDFDERAALDRILLRHGHLAFAPGTQTLYSNIGYWLLGPVVERVTGQPFAKFAERILQALGIAPSEIGYRFPADSSQAHGYLERYSLIGILRPFLTDKWIVGERIGRWLRIQDHYVDGPAFGGAIGTATGFCKLARHLLESRDPGFGWSRHLDFVQKEGGGAGFHAMLRLDAKRRRASVVLSNATGLDVSRCLDRLEALR